MLLTKRMRISDLGLDERIITLFKELGIEELYPPQAECIKYVLAKDNLVLAIPTASGKTLVAYLAILNSVLEEHGKAMYIVPLRALASEKYEELKKFESLGLKVAISYGDLDAPEPQLEQFDIIVVTSEKADSLLRHKTHWLTSLTTLVADEIHLIHDFTRGPTLEVILTRFKQLNPKAQIIALSATINNSEELAQWLDAKHFRSDWRPVPLKKGVLEENIIYFSDGTVKELEDREPIKALFLDVLKDNAQLLIFVNTRRSAEALAVALSNLTSNYLNSEEKNQLRELSDELVEVQAEHTSLGSELAKCVSKGVAFHHAGLSNAQRSLIERTFKNRLIKCIVATPTLAWGVNLPARRVVVRDLWRYDSALGASPLSVLEVLQMMGRAGRPQYDSYGEAILIARNEAERFKILENYLLGESENICSKLGNESALRTHLLASIATGFAHDYQGLRDFLVRTFFAYQRANNIEIEKLVETVVKFLIENEFVIERDEKLIPTKFGKRISELYIDPLSGIVLRDALKKARKAKTTDFSWLYTICSTPDMPLIYPRGKDKWLEEELVIRENDILVKDLSYEFELAYLKTTCLLNDWSSECTEEYISKKYDVGPGDIYSKTDTSEWLLYSMRELAKLFNPSVMPRLSKLILRVRYGVKEELLELVALKGIGRVRARALFKAGFKNLKDLRKASVEELAKVEKIGLAVAKSIKEQIR